MSQPFFILLLLYFLWNLSCANHKTDYVLHAPDSIGLSGSQGFYVLGILMFFFFFVLGSA